MKKRELIAFEKKVANLFNSGKIKVPVHLSGGNEDELINIFKKIRRDDYVFSTHRNHYHYLLHTNDKKGLMDEILGRNTGVCLGRSGSMHTCNPRFNFFSSAIVGGNLCMAVGVAFALKLQRSDKHVWCFIGDGAVDTGNFHEAYRFAVGDDLPITFVVEDNNRSVETTVHERWGKFDNLMNTLQECNKIIYYKYTPTYPHVGTGKEIQW